MKKILITIILGVITTLIAWAVKNKIDKKNNATNEAGAGTGASIGGFDLIGGGGSGSGSSGGSSGGSSNGSSNGSSSGGIIIKNKQYYIDALREKYPNFPYNSTVQAFFNALTRNEIKALYEMTKSELEAYLSELLGYEVIIN